MLRLAIGAAVVASLAAGGLAGAHTSMSPSGAAHLIAGGQHLTPLAVLLPHHREFEGQYKVGGTTCTVKPIRMAFEVRWAKGKGVQRFFFDRTTDGGKAVFISEDLGKGVDRFVFDDNKYNSGRFRRADGKTFTVRRMR